MTGVLLLLTLIITALPFAAGQAHAARDGQITIEPETTGGGIKRSSFVYTLDPGAMQTDKVVVSNLGDTPVDVDVYVANAFNTAGGKIGVKANTASVEAPATWLRYTTELGDGRLTLEPRTSKTIPFQVRVPDDATPGDYAFGIAAAPIVDPGTPAQGENQVTVVLAVATLVKLRVNGPLIPSVGITDLRAEATPPAVPGLKGGTTKVAFTVYNGGNQRLDAKVRITEYDARSRLMYTYPEISLPSLLPGTKLPLSYSWPDAPTLRGRVKVEVLTDAGVGTTRTATFWAIPWGFIVVVLALIALAVVGFRWRRSTRRVGDDTAVPSPEPEPVG